MIHYVYIDVGRTKFLTVREVEQRRELELFAIGDIGVNSWFSIYKNRYRGDFPGGTVVKNLPANAGDTGSIPGPGRSHMPRSN